MADDRITIKLDDEQMQVVKDALRRERLRRYDAALDDREYGWRDTRAVKVIDDVLMDIAAARGIPFNNFASGYEG